MTKKNWIYLETASGQTRLDIDSIIAMTKTYDTFGKEQWDLHMTSGTIFSINHAEYKILMKRMEEDEKPKYPGYSGNWPPAPHSYALRRWGDDSIYDTQDNWGEEE